MPMTERVWKLRVYLGTNPYLCLAMYVFIFSAFVFFPKFWDSKNKKQKNLDDRLVHFWEDE